MADEKLQRVRFVYEKARHHRTFHADGAWAGATPQGEVQFAFFNDLRPMPEFIEHDVNEQGVLGQEVERKHATQNIIREANVTVVMTKEMTRQLIVLLNTVLENLEAQGAKNKQSEAEPKDSVT